MKYSLIMIGSLLSVSLFACNYEVYGHCDEDEWEDEDHPCHDDHVYIHTEDGSGGNATGTGGSRSGTGAGGNGANGSGGSDGGSSGGGEGGSSSGGTCSSCTADPDPRDQICFWGETDLSVCCDSATLEAVAADKCQAVGLELKSFVGQLGQAECEAGHSALRYECCTEEAMVCVDRHVAFGSCFADSALEALAAETCSLDGGALDSFTAEHACDEGGFCEASFSCCAVK